MLCEKNGVLQTADVIEAGISKTYFMEYAKKKERVSGRKNSKTIFGGVVIMIKTSRQLKALVRNLTKKFSYAEDISWERGMDSCYGVPFAIAKELQSQCMEFI